MDWRPIFGTNGIRGIANKELTPDVALRLCLSLGTLMDEKSTVAVGRDTRISGEMLKNAAVSGLQSTGCSVIDLDIAPSPVIQYYVRDFADAGVIVTASHNPREYNGLKFVDGDGTEFSRNVEKEIERAYERGEFRRAGWKNIGKLSMADGISGYKEGVKKLVDVNKIRGEKFKVVVDPGGGAGCVVTPSLLRELGCTVIELNAQPDGTFPGRPPEPIEDALGELISLVKKTRANLGVALDGDADRAVFVDENGAFVSEDVLLAIFAKHTMLERKKGIVVIPVSSSQCVVDVVEQNGGTIVWTPVGSIHVARRMIETGAVFGGEGNGGLIFPEHLHGRDGTMAAAKILEMLSDGKPLSQLADEIPKYFHIKRKITVPDKDAVMKELGKVVKGNVDTTDGVKIWHDDGWVLVRASGTEPIIRVFAESKTMERARELMQEGVELVKQPKRV